MEYLKGFSNHFESEALAGALPQGQNSPKQPSHGLVPEQLSGSAFTRPRSSNLRSWLYRIRPSTAHKDYQSRVIKGWSNQVDSYELATPNPLRWSASPLQKNACDFLSGIQSMASTLGSPGVSIHHYLFDQSMACDYFFNGDGDMLFVPQSGALEVKTEFGDLHVKPLEIVVVPRGVKFQVNPLEGGKPCRGYFVENFGEPFVLPDLGPLGANALANPRDFSYPVARFEEASGEYRVTAKLGHAFWVSEQEHHPLDVVAWHGNYLPYKYDLRLFNTMGSVSYDHPDPSIYTVLTSPSGQAGVANLDFVIFPPRWLVAEDTFRPPYYHRNVMSEYMGLIDGEYDAKAEGFEPGGASLHNRMSAHGPDTETFQKATESGEEPQKVDNTMAFMFETSMLLHPSIAAMNSTLRQLDYTNCWQNFKPLFRKS